MFFRRFSERQLRKLISLGRETLDKLGFTDSFGRRKAIIHLKNNFQLVICLIPGNNTVSYDGCGLFFDLVMVCPDGRPVKLPFGIQTPRIPQAVRPQTISHLSRVSSRFVRKLIRNIKKQLKKDT